MESAKSFYRMGRCPADAERVEEARRAAILIKQSGIIIDGACTSVLNRAIHSLWLIMETLDQMWLPVDKTWRLNERHYGALQGMDKDKAAQQIGQKIVYHWRRSYRGLRLHYWMRLLHFIVRHVIVMCP